MYFIRSVAGSYGLISAVQPPVVIHFTYVRNAAFLPGYLCCWLYSSDMYSARLFRFDSCYILSFEDWLFTFAVSYAKASVYKIQYLSRR